MPDEKGDTFLTRQAALANAEVVIAEWIEAAREPGRPIHEPNLTFAIRGVGLR
jgi:predicted RNase H-like HicB family nuclease